MTSNVPGDASLPDIDLDRPNVARMYDYMLGGAQNFRVDRDAVAKVLEAHPEAEQVIRQNRAFLSRVVQWCVEQGIDQFLDLGSGVPTVGNVHEIAHAMNPAVRVAYVDIEPVAVAAATRLTAGIDTVTITRADLCEPSRVLGEETVAGLLDFSRPVALLAVSVLHFVHEDLNELIGHYLAALVPGSIFAFSHASDDHDDPVDAARLRAGAEVYRGTTTPPRLRDRAELRMLLDGLDVVEPGVVDVSWWHSDGGGTSGNYGAVARILRPSGV